MAASRASELRHSPIVKAVQQARPSIVNIRGEKTLAPAAPQHAHAETSRRVNGMGTGVVIDPRGYIITNHHVVDGVREIQVTTADGQRYVARLIARDTETDLAVVKIDAPEKLPVIPVGTSSDLMPGETVLAVGNAYGYEHTVTRGIISALHRAVQVSDAQFYDDLIQTDASINPGNSGGPLLNIDGEMVGINVAVRAGAQGIGFAIPADKTLAVAAKLIESCNRRVSWHGVNLVARSGPPEQGLLVASVDQKSPAAEAGLQTGDVITSVDGEPVGRTLDFQRAMLELEAGQHVRLAVRRTSKPLDVELTLAEPPRKPDPDGHRTWEVLGLKLETIPSSEFRQKHSTRYRGGLAVAAVRPGGPAAVQGIRPGDVLVGMHIWETVSVENVAYILERADFHSLNPLKFFILRGDDTLYGYLPVSVKTAQR
jgi:serine protease Do